MADRERQEIDTSRLERGHRGEEAAVEALVRGGCRIVDRNWSCKRAEVDVVAETADGTLLFVEVRSTNTSYLETPADTVDARKQGQVIRAARFYLQSEVHEPREVRFDVVAVHFEEDELRAVRWLKDAFRPPPSGQRQCFTW